MTTLRHRARQYAFQFLFQNDIVSQGAAERPPLTPDLISGLLTRHFTHFDVPEEVREFVAELSTGTLLHIGKIDEAIQARAKNWTLARMAAVDRNILRVAAFELLYRPDTPRAVVIDEAVELAKEFGEADSPAFVNGILDQLTAAA